MERGWGDISHDQAQAHKYFPLMCTPPCFFPFNHLNVRQYKLFLYFLAQNNDNNNSSKYYRSIFVPVPDYRATDVLLIYFNLTTLWDTIIISFPFFRWRNWSVGRLSSLPEITSGRAGVSTLRSQLQRVCSLRYWGHHSLILLGLVTCVSYFMLIQG